MLSVKHHDSNDPGTGLTSEAARLGHRGARLGTADYLTRKRRPLPNRALVLDGGQMHLINLLTAWIAYSQALRTA